MDLKKLLDMDSPVVRFMGRVGDLIVLNALFLVCSLPLVTIGASLTAMIRVIQGILIGSEPGIIKTFFRAFRKNFAQATAAWLLLAVLIAALGYNIFFVGANFTGGLATGLKAAAGALLAVVLAAGGYVFPLIARYENTLRRHLLNALILAVAKLPRTMCVTALNVLPAALAYFSLRVFFYSIAVWVLVGFAAVCWLDCLLLRPVLRQLEQPPESREDEESQESQEN